MVNFHGQAAVESGCSVNEDMLVEKLLEDSIAQRVVYNAINFYGGVLNVPIPEIAPISQIGINSQEVCIDSTQGENRIGQYEKETND